MSKIYKWSPNSTRRFMNIYAPLLGAGVRVNYISEDWRKLKVSMKLRWYNRNAVGVHFGGSLYSMTDPHIMLMLMRILGPNYIVWDKAAEIEFVSPGKGKVSCDIEIDLSTIQEIISKTENGKSYLHNFELSVLDENHATVAEVVKTLYIKKKI